MRGAHNRRPTPPQIISPTSTVHRPPTTDRPHIYPASINVAAGHILTPTPFRAVARGVTLQRILAQEGDRHRYHATTAIVPPSTTADVPDATTAAALTSRPEPPPTEHNV